MDLTYQILDNRVSGYDSEPAMAHWRILRIETETGSDNNKTLDYSWHYDDNLVVKAADRVYGQFRGYGTVETLTGDTQNTTNGP